MGNVRSVLIAKEKEVSFMGRASMKASEETANHMPEMLPSEGRVTERGFFELEDPAPFRERR